MKTSQIEQTEYQIDKLVKDFKKSMEAISKEKAVIGLSGGIDSAVAAALILKAIGRENVIAVNMPYKPLSQVSSKAAKMVAGKFRLNFEIFDITEPIDAFFKTMPDASDLRRGNAMARIRMAYLFDRAQTLGGIVAGTSNKTEILLGYGTWYGDTASSINILGTLYKREVYSIAEVLGVPQSIIKREPSADLWDGQTDEGEFGFSYKVADEFLYAMFEENKNKTDLKKQFGAEITKKIIDKVITNSFKRNMPVITCGKISFFKDIEKRLNTFMTEELI